VKSEKKGLYTALKRKEIFQKSKHVESLLG